MADTSAPKTVDTAFQKAQRRIHEHVEHLVSVSEMVIVVAAEILMLLAVVIAGVMLYALFAQGVVTTIISKRSLDDLQNGLAHVFAGVLLLVLGLELMKSLESFFVSFRVQVEIIVVVAMIAVARHVMLMDLEHSEASKIAAAGILILALAISYVLVRQPALPRATSETK
jgi:uncharacterized membrane protein (DUF373 family)